MPEPRQNKGYSKQDYQTPPELLEAIKDKLDIDEFSVDLAASHTNAVAPVYYTPETDALDPRVHWAFDEWAWCNPPYGNIGPWVHKACHYANEGSQICMLVPASVGANWWRDFVQNEAYVLFMNGRVKFVGAKDYYPKDTAILLYTAVGYKGSEVWTWQ